MAYLLVDDAQLRAIKSDANGPKRVKSWIYDFKSMAFLLLFFFSFSLSPQQRGKSFISDKWKGALCDGYGF